MTPTTGISGSSALTLDGRVRYDLHEVMFVRVATLVMLFGGLTLCLGWVAWGQWLRLAGTLPYVLVAGFTWHLLQAGKTPTAFRVLAWGAWGCAVNGMLLTNGIFAPGVSVFILVIGFSGYLVSTRTTVALVALTVVVLLLAALAAQEGWPLPLPASPAPIFVFLVYLVIALVAGALGLFSVQINRGRFERLQRSEASLAEKLDQLTRSEARLARAMDATNDGLWEWDIASGRTYFSPSYFRMLGYEEGEFASTSNAWIELTHPEDRERALGANQNCIDNRAPSFAVEFRMRAKDGTWRWILGRGKAVTRDASGKALLLVGTHVDITERKLAEQELRDWRERMRAAERVAGLGTWYIELPGDRIRWSEGTYRIFGVDPAQPAPSWGPFVERIHPEDRQRVKDAIGRLYRDREPGQVECRIVRSDGEIRHLRTSATLTYDKSGKPLEMIGASIDVTEGKRADEALRDSEEHFRALFNAITDAVFVHGIGEDGMPGRFLEVNDVACQHLGYAREELLRLSPADIDAPDSGVDVPTVGRRVMAGETVIFEQEHVARDGRRIPVEIHAQKFRLGSQMGVMALVRDITQRKRMEQAHVRSQKLESLGTLAGGIAHDFNNILLAINGNARLALEDLAADHPARESVAEIARAGKRAADLVRRILTFSRPEGEKREMLDLSAVLDEALRLLRSTLPATIDFRTRYGGHAPLVAADAAQIHEAIVNLATNAAYAIADRAGTIEFGVEGIDVDSDLAARVPGLRPGRYACLSVADNGCGMDEATAGRIFDAFFTTKPAGQGTGLGLSMVHGIVKGHAGAIAVETEPGKGSIFRLYFPAAGVKVKTERAPRSVETAPAGGWRVLYIDDEEALVFLASRALTRLGHTVTGYADPQEALERFRARPADFDVVVTDMSMPRMSGFDVARQALAMRPDLPLILTTGYIRADDEERARAVGVREIILKPNTVDELGQVLDRLLRSGI